MLRPNQRRARLERLGGADHMRQLFPVDRDGLGGVFRSLERIGDHKGDRVADMAHFLARKDRIGWNVKNRVRKLDGAWQGTEIGGLSAGEHQAYAGHPTRLASFIVKDANGQQIAYVYFEDEPQRQMSMKRLSRDEAFLIAVNIAKLPSVPRQILKAIGMPIILLSALPFTSRKLDSAQGQRAEIGSFNAGKHQACRGRGASHAPRLNSS